MADELKRTVRIVRQPKVITDDRGRRVWNAPVDPVELDLVSTVHLQHLLSTDSQAKEKIEAAALQETSDTTVLAHDAASDSYEFVDAQGNDEFSLVSTQMLFRMLEKDNPVQKESKDRSSLDDDIEVAAGGFDPYNSG